MFVCAERRGEEAGDGGRCGGGGGRGAGGDLAGGGPGHGVSGGGANCQSITASTC